MINFSKPQENHFYITVRKRVDDYFKKNQLSKFGNKHVAIKTITLLSLLFLPYGLLLSGYWNFLELMAIAALMGFANACIGMSIMHDSQHGSYSSSTNINKVFGHFVYILICGGNPICWRLQHNVLHHRYTNIFEKDEDLNPYGTMRFSPEAGKKSIFKYQHIYAPLLYTFLTLIWSLHKEFFQIARYYKMGLIKQKSAYQRELAKLVIGKCIYFSYILVLPLYLTSMSILQWLSFFLAYHAVCGVILCIIFQLAHVVKGASFPKLNHKGNIDNEWAVHQMQTTSNFSPKSRIMSWLIGGLNYQVEHHLFPTVSHIHYKKISRIVKKTAVEFNIPYHCHNTIWNALRSHFKLLKQLGEKK